MTAPATHNVPTHYSMPRDCCTCAMAMFPRPTVGLLTTVNPTSTPMILHVNRFSSNLVHRHINSSLTLIPLEKMLQLSVLTIHYNASHTYVQTRVVQHYSHTVLHKEILVFTFSFNLNLSSKDIKVENM